MRHRKQRKRELTDGWCKAVKPEAGAVDYRDTERRGLVFRVEPPSKRNPEGLKTWFVVYRFEGRDRRYRIGPYPEVGIKDARIAAKGKVSAAALGTDPAAERERLRIGEAVPAVVDAWLADLKRGPAGRWKGGLKGGTARSYLPHVRAFREAFAAEKLVALTTEAIERFVSEPAAPATRNRRLVAVRMVYAWAARKRIVPGDVTRALGKEREDARARLLSDGELAALIRGFDGTRYGPAVRLLALTGLRRDEVLGARFDWLDADGAVLTIPPAAEKTGRSRGEARRVALSPQASALITAQREALFAEGVRSEFVFATSTGSRPHPDALKPTLNRLRGLRSNGLAASTDKRAKARRAALPADVNIHDVRRTVADALLNRCGASPWIVDFVVLGHARPKLLRTYMPTLPLAEAREALTRWAETFNAILTANAAGGAR